VAVARRAFGAKGYDATSLRSIATQAGVDPGLLVHYFGTKEGVFQAAIDVAVQPGQLFRGLEGLSTQEVAEQLVRRYMMVLDRDESRDIVMGLIRSAVSNERAADVLRNVLFRELLTSLEPLIEAPDAELRASLIVAQLVGIATLRYVVRDGAVVKATDDEIVGLVSSAVERYLR
jgi:AcrR family transcriptional regulator